MCKIIQSSQFLQNMIGNLGKNVLMYLAVPLTKDVLPLDGVAEVVKH